MREEGERTWRPAREDRETGFFLSLSFPAAVVFAAKSPFPPFPAIFTPNPSKEIRKEREIQDPKEPKTQTRRERESTLTELRRLAEERERETKMRKETQELGIYTRRGEKGKSKRHGRDFFSGAEDVFYFKCRHNYKIIPAF